MGNVAAVTDTGKVPAFADHTVERYAERYGKECARITMSGRQMLRYFIIAAVLLTFVNYDYKQFFILVNFVACAIYVVTIVFKFFTVLLSMVRRSEVTVTPEELAGLSEAGLPVYTVLVPLYRESNVADSIMRAIDALDYPKDKLDVKFLLEADDKQTLTAIQERGVPDYGEIIVAPEAGPRTKPRACNHGLERAKGDYLVIYDAEDRPEPDQLKKSVAAFSKLGEKVVCLQAKLNYYNPRQNALTKWFTMEYSV